MAALQRYQKTLSLGKLYKVQIGYNEAHDALAPSIWVNSGSVDIYTSDSATQPIALSAMTLNTDDTGVIGKQCLDCLSTYISVKQNTGTTTEIVVSGLDITDLGAIA